jgi:hypothetical protein
MPCLRGANWVDEEGIKIHAAFAFPNLLRLLDAIYKIVWIAILYSRFLELNVIQ